MKEGIWPLIVIVLVALLAYVLVASTQASGVAGTARLLGYHFPSRLGISTPPSAAGARIGLSDDKPVEGQIINARIDASSCPAGTRIQVLINGQAVASADASDSGPLSVPLLVKSGSNLLEVKGAGCSSSYEFLASARECFGDLNASCILSDGCEGVQTCGDGKWSGCQPLPRICRPGRTAPCDLNSCSFGVSTCNSCGTGWGPCTVPSSNNS